MPNKRIDQLPPNGNQIQGTDKLPIFSDGKTERITVNELSSFIESGSTNTFVSGGTYSNGTLTIGRNDGVDLVVSGFLTGSSISYKSYNSVITQTGTTAPTEVVLQNDLGLGPISWARLSTGEYEATLTGLFTDPTKVQIFITNQHVTNFGSADNIIVNVRVSGANKFVLTVGVPSFFSWFDDELLNTSLEIRLWD